MASTFQKYTLSCFGERAHLIHTCTDNYSERAACGRQILPASRKKNSTLFSALQPYRSQLTSSQNKQRGVEKQETGRPEKGNNSALSHQKEKKKMGKGDRRRDIAKRSGLGSGRRVMKIMSGRPVGWTLRPRKGALRCLSWVRPIAFGETRTNTCRGLESKRGKAQQDRFRNRDQAWGGKDGFADTGLTDSWGFRTNRLKS